MWQRWSSASPLPPGAEGAPQALPWRTVWVKVSGKYSIGLVHMFRLGFKWRAKKTHAFRWRAVAKGIARRRERELLGFEWAQATLFPCLAVQAPLRVGGARGVN